LTGLDGAPVERLASGSLAAWVSRMSADVRPTMERLREHERVVRAALRKTTPLPFRFGVAFRDEGELTDVLDDRADQFEATLSRLGNRIEMGLRVTYTARESPGEAAVDPRATAPAASHPTSGRAYLEGRRAALRAAAGERERAERTLEEVEGHFADLELESVKTIGDGAEIAGSLAHLLHRGQLRLYRNRVARLQSNRSDLLIRVTGPWAPYSFV
jgi:Gas vesicle synthesis protein GvpL/GvpF